MTAIDYTAAAELYAQRPHAKQLFYRRFPNAAEALQFAVEQPPSGMASVWIEVDEERYLSADILAAYQADGYPLARAPEPKKRARK